MKKIFCSLLIAAISISIMPTPSFASSLPGGGEPDPATVKAAIAEFKSLPKQERKERIKEAKKEWKQFKKDKKSGKSKKVEQVVLIILAILLPPLAVYLHYGEINNR